MPREQTDELAELWLDTLQELASVAAHEIKGALNGVAVSLEVVRVRAGSGKGENASVERFAASAARQLEALTARTEALLSLTRPAREPVEIGAVVATLVTLLDPAAESHGGSVRLEDEADGATSPVSGAAARLVLAAVLRAAMAGANNVRCAVELDSGIRVRVRRDDAAAAEIDASISAAATDAGIQLERKASEVTVMFPAGTR